jgi:hypothetical protein
VRLNEFIHSPKNTPESNLTTALELIRNRYKDQDTAPKISTQSLINLVLNTDKTFDYDALVSANTNNPALKNIIKSYNKDYIELWPAGEDNDSSATVENPKDQDADPNAPVDTVSNMAKSAAKRRGAAGF